MKPFALPSLLRGKKFQCWINDKNQYHREDGPAIIEDNGDKYWFIHGKQHRIDGPASEFADGGKEWFYEDEHIKVSSQEEFKKHLQLKLFW